MSLENILPAAVGGVLIGLASLLMWGGPGRIAGISGIIGRVIGQRGAFGWPGYFLSGLLLSGAVMSRLYPELFHSAATQSLPTLVGAGLLVGVGSRLGSGCTSGHGVCGMGRLSPRSIAATMTFMATGVLAVALVRQLTGGA